MDITNSLDMGATLPLSRLARFTVTMGGLTDNPTHGRCAERGVPVTAVLEDLAAAQAGDIVYQWYVAGEGPVPGATEAVFVPTAPLVVESVIYCVVTVAGQGSRASAGVVFRDASPQPSAGLPDEVFDLDTGPQTVVAARAFTGENLRFGVSGAGATINPVTGLLSISTEAEVDGVLIIVTATNSGGSASAGFRVAVEDVAVEGAMPFGALTPAGVGGVPVNATAIVEGDPAGHWQVSEGMLVPSVAGEGALSGFYPLVFDSGETLDVAVENGKASARVEELAVVFAGLPLSARGLMVQNGDARPLGRIRLAPKVFDAEMVLEPTNWLEDLDPRQSLRPVVLGGLTIGGDPSGNRILRMENLTVQGFECQLEQGPDEGESNNGIILVERPSRHVTIRQNEIWSRDLAEIVAADDFRDNLSTSRQMRGIATKVYSGVNEHIRVEQNHIHDVSRGVIMTETSHYENVRSRLCGNVIEDCYTNFFTAGYLDGLDIFDNRCMGIYAANGDTLGAIPATSPHSACGGSFDAGESRTTQNVTMMGNLFHTGWKRTKLHAENGLPKPQIGATGIKFNDPQASDSYWNLVVAFNTVISHGICMEISGAQTDGHTDVFNNTLASESYAGVGSGPVYYFCGAQNVRLYNNIGTNYTRGALDGSGIYARTLETLEGYGNVWINTGSADFGEIDYFTGDSVKGLQLLTIDEAMTAYTPKAGTRAMTAAQKKGAQGTGLYMGDGIHSAPYDKPAVATGTAHDYPLTAWNGSYLQRDRLMLGSSSAQGLTFAFQGRSSTEVDGANAVLFSTAGQAVYIYKSSGGAVVVKAESGSETFIEGYGAASGIRNSDGLVSYVCSLDFEKGVLLFAANGRLANWDTVRTLQRRSLAFTHNPRVFANELTAAGDRWQGDLGVFYLTDAFVDLETPEGLGRFYAADGRFVDLGADGSGPTGTPPLIFLKGEGVNLGRGGDFSLRS
jgi:hypothetical protein